MDSGWRERLPPISVCVNQPLEEGPTMSRRIVTVAPQAGGKEKVELSTYSDKAVGYIPADVVAAYIAAVSIIAAASGVPAATLLWIVFLFGLVITPLWTRKQTMEPNKPTAIGQIIISTIAFAVWVFALGGPFVSMSWYNSAYGALLLIGFTLAAPLLPVKQE